VPLDARCRRGHGGAAHPAAPDGRYVKVSLDIQVTSTRRTISVASTRNGPVLSRLLRKLLPSARRVLLLDETAGSAMVAAAGDRDLAAILRSGLSDRLGPGRDRGPPGPRCTPSHH
jgi:siderophore synthetase component